MKFPLKLSAPKHTSTQTRQNVVLAQCHASHQRVVCPYWRRRTWFGHLYVVALVLTTQLTFPDVVAAYGAFAILLPLNVVYISIAVGAALIFLGFFGHYASNQAKHGSKCGLCVYIILVFACLAAQVASIVLFTQLDGLVTTQEPLISGSLDTESQKMLNNAILSTYVACCTGCNILAACNGDNVLPFYDHGLSNCNWGGAVPLCAPAIPCLVLDQTGCFNTGLGTGIPRIKVEENVCGALAQIELEDGKKLVGPAGVEGGCGGGNPTAYSANMLSWFGDKLKYVLIAMGILLAMQALNLLAALVICRTSTRNLQMRVYEK